MEMVTTWSRIVIFYKHHFFGHILCEKVNKVEEGDIQI